MLVHAQAIPFALGVEATALARRAVGWWLGACRRVPLRIHDPGAGASHVARGSVADGNVDHLLLAADHAIRHLVQLIDLQLFSGAMHVASRASPHHA